MSTTQLGSGRATWGYIIFLGLGMSMGLTTVMTAAQLSAPRELMLVYNVINTEDWYIILTVSVRIVADS